MSTGPRRPAGPGQVLQAVHVSIATARGKRHRNEDAIGLDGWVLQGEDVNPMTIVRRMGNDRSVAVAVTDGLGTGPDGDRAAQIAARLLTDRRLHRYPSVHTLLTAFQDSDASLHRTEEASSRGMGCAAAMIIVRPDGLALVGNVGDVRIYWLVDGYLGQLTRDDRLDTVNVVSRCLGGRYPTTVDPHSDELVVRPNDRLLICSDGLHDAVSPDFIEAALKIKSADHAVAELVRAAKDAGSGDVTVAVLDIQGLPVKVQPPPTPAQPPRRAQPVAAQQQPVPRPAPQQQAARQESAEAGGSRGLMFRVWRFITGDGDEEDRHDVPGT